MIEDIMWRNMAKSNTTGKLRVQSILCHVKIQSPNSEDSFKRHYSNADCFKTWIPLSTRKWGGTIYMPKSLAMRESWGQNIDISLRLAWATQWENGSKQVGKNTLKGARMSWGHNTAFFSGQSGGFRNVHMNSFHRTTATGKNSNKLMRSKEALIRTIFMFIKVYYNSSRNCLRNKQNIFYFLLIYNYFKVKKYIYLTSYNSWFRRDMARSIMQRRKEAISL